jgi:eukaryotic-like serine/threonine-protein kinase
MSGLEDDTPPEEFPIETTVVTQAFSPGSFFGDRFRIERLLGVGGMGNVYDAVDLENDRHVALKVLKKASALTAEAGERFRREAEILAAARHPGIVGIHGFGQAPDGTAWLAMELLAGETLRERVTREGAMSPAALVPILTAASDALTKAHSRGVVHRDLKPDHIFLPADGGFPVKVLDFGLSRAIGNKKLTKTGMVLGTPRYMSPEQIASAHASDGQSDVYALGVIVYEALTGKSPFVASDHGQLLGAILQSRIEPLAKVRPDLPQALGDVLIRSMAKDRAIRYKTPTDFAEDFARVVYGGAEPPNAALAGAARERPRFASQAAEEASFRARLASGRAARTGQPSRRRGGLPPWWVVLASFLAGALLAAAGAFLAYSLMR